MTPAEVEKYILEVFEENYQRLVVETGAAVTPDVKVAALEQVLLYYRKMREVAETVTETEVHLTLPEQRTPKGRKFTLEGVVDIVQEGDRTIMYDLKTHFDVEQAKGQLDQYIRQLNVYAHIWHNLRGQPLDATAIIATRPTRDVRAALRAGDTRRIERAIENWNPCIEIPLNPMDVQEMINEFGTVVDRIEERTFNPPPVQLLERPSSPGGRNPFGTTFCGNCDVRFSCNSYRQFAARTQGGLSMQQAMHYYLNDYGADFERTEWLDANMETDGHDRFGDLQGDL